MSKFGWDLPPGCSINDLPGNTPAEQMYEALGDRIHDTLKPICGDRDDDEFLKVCEAIVKIVADAYGDGYQQAMADNKMAEEYNEGK